MKVFKLDEMPYLKVKDKIFDLELERFNNATDIINYILSIFDGKQMISKQGTQIKLLTHEDKLQFFDSLYHDSIFLSIQNRFLTSDQKSFLYNEIRKRI